MTVAERPVEPLHRRLGVTDDELARALDWYRLVPWYDVLWGQAAGGQDSVESGLAGIAARLNT